MTRSVFPSAVDGANIPLSRVTTFQLGGPCRRLTTCSDPDTFCRTLHELAAVGVTPFVMGGGSNLLISDDGLDNVVVRYVRDRLEPIRIGEGWVEVDGSAPLAALADWSVEEGWEGLEFATGIPGTVGGGVAGNAGAFGRQLADGLERLEVVDARGNERVLSPEELGFSYRSSRIDELGLWVVRARFRIRRGDRVALRAERDRVLEFRRTKHPDWRVTPTAGSFFRNIEPTSAAARRQAAGWFLDQIGARSFQVGGAGVYEKHANIVIKKTDDCSARDVFELTRQMADAVERKFGIRLIPEVKRIGFN